MTNGGLKHATTRQQNLKPFSNLGNLPDSVGCVRSVVVNVLREVERFVEEVLGKSLYWSSKVQESDGGQLLSNP